MYEVGSRLLPVAQYLRMSTEHQRYSTTNQGEAIDKYVRAHGMEVIRTYEDSGRSGLTLTERPALQQLLADVHAPERSFQAVVVFDVSRWGRFQDVDESAYYEFLCRRAGVQVVYCAEPFGDVSGPMAVVIKSIKRAMAAEFSRELGVKVLAGQCQLLSRGFHMGGFASFGLRRVLVSEAGEVKARLKRREMKSIQTDRVVLEPDDPLDVALIRYIFGLFVRKRMREADVARVLNWSNYPGRTGLHPWNSQSVREVLRNERYVGTLIYNRTSRSLKTPQVQNPPEKWALAEHCFKGIVSQTTFDKAQRLIRERSRHLWTDEELLSMVRRVHEKHGTITPNLMLGKGCPDSTLYIHHFGSLANACEAAGIDSSERLRRQSASLQRRHRMKLEMLEALARMYRTAAVGFTWYRTTRRACVEGGPTLSVRSAPVIIRNGRPRYWVVTNDKRVLPDVSLIARVDVEGASVLDYFLLPLWENRHCFINIDGKAAHDWIDRYRHATLDDVFQQLELLRRRSRIPMVPRLSVSLAKRRRRVLGIRKRLALS